MHRLVLRARLIGLAMFVAFFAISAQSKAEPRLTMDWERFVKHGTDLVLKLAESEKEAPAPAPPTLGAAWFGVSPRASLVARDWGGATRLAGAKLSLTDEVRLSRSSQMIMTRLRVGDPWNRINPFVQIGFGQWRVDTELMPRMRQDPELAAQAGAGLEIRVTGRWLFAAEVNGTVLYREKHEPNHLAAPRMWGSFLASRVEF